MLHIKHDTAAEVRITGNEVEFISRSGTEIIVESWPLWAVLLTKERIEQEWARVQAEPCEVIVLGERRHAADSA